MLPKTMIVRSLLQNLRQKKGRCGRRCRGEEEGRRGAVRSQQGGVADRRTRPAGILQVVRTGGGGHGTGKGTILQGAGAHAVPVAMMQRVGGDGKMWFPSPGGRGLICGREDVG
nr:unnamed protein product [Digitaria exilis]